MLIFQNNIEYVSIFKNILNMLRNNNIGKINILFDMSNNILDILNIKKDFRQIYTFNNDNNDNNNFIKYYEYDINNIVKNINYITEEILFCIDFKYYSDNNSLYYVLKNIGKRYFNDIIFIINLHTDNEILFTKIIKRRKNYYIYKNVWFF